MNQDVIAFAEMFARAIEADATANEQNERDYPLEAPLYAQRTRDLRAIAEACRLAAQAY